MHCNSNTDLGRNKVSAIQGMLCYSMCVQYVRAQSNQISLVCVFGGSQLGHTLPGGVDVFPIDPGPTFLSNLQSSCKPVNCLLCNDETDVSSLLV